VEDFNMANIGRMFGCLMELDMRGMLVRARAEQENGVVSTLRKCIVHLLQVLARNGTIAALGQVLTHSLTSQRQDSSAETSMQILRINDVMICEWIHHFNLTVAKESMQLIGDGSHV
jgi:hypothetical protein